MKSDKVFMRIKDGLLILISLLTIYKVFIGRISQPVYAEWRVASLEKSVEENKKLEDERAAKYIPMIEADDKNLAVVISQNNQVISRLERIERKLDTRG